MSERETTTMNEREIKQLIRLLVKFQRVYQTTDCRENCSEEFNAREQSVIGIVVQWVKWYGRDELDLDVYV